MRVSDTGTADYVAGKPDAARRPLNCVLDPARPEKAWIALPDWRESLARYVTAG